MHVPIVKPDLPNHALCGGMQRFAQEGRIPGYKTGFI